MNYINHGPKSMMYKEQIKANKLKTIRLTLGFNQVDVAKKLGMKSSDRISHCELGKAIPNIINLFKLCKLYKVTPAEIYPLLEKEALEN
jgi:transcriptional regulator with XRE-family HTH domain